MTDLEQKYMTEDMGGDVKKQIIKYRLVMFNCTCGFLIESPNIKGYEHSGGFKDEDGKKWWMYVHCPKCEYDWALKKIDHRVQQMERDSLPLHFNRFFEDMKENEMKMRKAKNAPTQATMYLLYLPNKIDVVPLEGHQGRSPLDFVAPILQGMERAHNAPDAYVVVAEAWFKMLSKHERENWRDEAKKIKYGDIQRDVENRKECLVVNGASRDKTWVKSQFFHIERTNGEITGYTDDNDEPDMHSNKMPGMKKIPEDTVNDFDVGDKNKKGVK